MQEKYILTILLTIIMAKAEAQETIIGKIIDKNNSPVSYATVLITNSNLGTISDENGLFSINKTIITKNDTLKISAIGYEQELFPIIDYFEIGSFVIKIRSKVYAIKEITISPENPRMLLEGAIKSLPKNCYQKPYVYDAFFRQYHRENNRSARLIESSISIYNPGYVFTQSKEFREEIKINALRRSNVYEQNGFEHGEHLSDMLLKNMVNYPFATVLNPRSLSYYNLSYEYLSDSTSPNTILVIHYFYKENNDYKIESGSIYINAQTNKILKIAQNTFPNANYTGITNNRSLESNWKFIEESFTLTFKEIEGFMYPDNFNFYYKHRIYNPTFHTNDYVVEEFFDLYPGKVYSKPELTATLNDYKKLINLYTRSYKYDLEFWKKYTILNDYPIDNKIMDEFNTFKNLENQFEENGR